MRIKILLFMSLMFLGGCASSINYKIDRSDFKGISSNKVIAIGIFKDQRPEIEHKGEKGAFVRTYRSGDKDFKKDIPLQIGEMLVKHVEQSGLFNHVLLRDLKDDFYLDPQEVNQLIDQGVDIVVIGRLGHFYAFQDMPNAGLSMFGLVGALTDMAINKKSVGAGVEYSDLKVIDLKTLAVIWEGNIDYHFDDIVGSPAASAYYWRKALREANNRFVQKLDEVVLKN